MSVPDILKGNTKKKQNTTNQEKGIKLNRNFAQFRAVSKPKRNVAINSLLSLFYNKLQAGKS